MHYDKAKLKVIIGGDTCPIGRNLPLFEAGDALGLLNNLVSDFKDADLSIVNLECPLIQVESPIEKVGPSLGVPRVCVNGLKAMGVGVVGLANNHIMDHGIKGLRTTIRALQSRDIAYVGAGVNLQEARRIHVHDVKGLRIGILAMAEHEFGIAGENTYGVNPLDVIEFVRNINENCSTYDKLIVLVHGGNEHYPYPRPGLMNTCRFLVEQGASAVVCQHSHCAGCMETYMGVPVIYGQGNFLFDFSSKKTGMYKGALVSLMINDAGNFEVQMIPYRQSDGQPGARRMTEDEERAFLSAFGERSQAIMDASFVKTQWERFCQDNKRFYLNTLFGKPGFLRRLAGKLDLLHYLDSRDVLEGRLHLIRCESHREALISTLQLETDR